jgi:hypothetical protein
MLYSIIVYSSDEFFPAFDILDFIEKEGGFFDIFIGIEF